MTKSPAEPLQNPPTELICELCGRADAVEMGDRVLCPECYQTCGSCCAGSALEDQN